MGFFDTFIVVLVLPEMIDVVEKKLPGLTKESKTKLADYSSGIVAAFFGFG